MGTDINFPIRDGADRVKQIGILVVEVTAQRKLEEYLCKLVGTLHCRKPAELVSYARELQESIKQYHAALAVGLDVLRRKKESSELMAQSVQELDRKILAMRKLVSDAVSRFPIDI